MSDRSALDWDAIDEVARKARERFAYCDEDAVYDDEGAGA